MTASFQPARLTCRPWCSSCSSKAGCRRHRRRRASPMHSGSKWLKPAKRCDSTNFSKQIILISVSGYWIFFIFKIRQTAAVTTVTSKFHDFFGSQYMAGFCHLAQLCAAPPLRRVAIRRRLLRVQAHHLKTLGCCLLANWSYHRQPMWSAGQTSYVQEFILQSSWWQ